MRSSARATSAVMGAGFALAIVLRGVHAAGDGESAQVALTWNAPAECPAADDVRAEIARLVAGTPAHAPFDAKADVSRAGDAWRVHLVTSSGSAHGERSLTADSCRGLADATAFIIAMSIDPERATANRVSTVVPDAGALAEAKVGADVDAGAAPDARAEADAGAQADAEAAVDAHAVAQTEVDAAAPPSSDRAFAMGLGGAIDTGSLPSAALGPMLFASWRQSFLRLELSGAYFPGNHVSTARGATAAFSVVAVDALGCFEFDASPFVLGPCAGGELTVLRGTASGVLDASSASGGGATFAFALGGRGEWRFADAWGLVLRLDAGFPLNRPDFQIDGASVHKPSAVRGRGSLGVELRF